MQTMIIKNGVIHLSEKAAWAYHHSDPLTITAHDDDTYSVRGVLDRDGMTEDDVYAFLEDLADKAAESEIEDDTLYFGPAEWYADTPTTMTGAEVKALAREWGASMWDIWQQIDEPSPQRGYIVNSEGRVFYPDMWDAITAMMDDELREEIAADIAPCTNQTFFTAYASAHLAKFGEVWELDKANPVW